MFRSILLSLATLLTVQAGAQRFNILDYGAVSDTGRLSTAAINKAVNACYQKGGGQVIIPAGNFKSGTITLPDNVELHFERGATLYASTSPSDFPRQQQPAYRSQKDPGGWYALIYAAGAKNIGITGFGTIDGQGARQLPRVSGNVIDDHDGRPRNMLLISCKNITVEGITMLNSGMWNQHYLDCEDVTINNIRVYNHSNKNNDGIDFDGCRRAILSNSILDSDDDCITLKSTGAAPCEHITITNCIASSFCNAIKCGTESTGGFRNIVITGCVVKPSRCTTEPVFKTPRIGQTGIALEIVDGGIMEGVRIDNIVIEGTECPIYVRLGNRARKHIAEAPAPGFGIMRNIGISNITAYNTGNFTSSITGVPGAIIDNISLSNISITNKGGLQAGEYRTGIAQVEEREKEYPDPTAWGNLPASGFFIRHVNQASLSNIQLHSVEQDPRVPVLADDVNDLFISNLQAAGAAEKHVQLNNVRTYKKQ